MSNFESVKDLVLFAHHFTDVRSVKKKYMNEFRKVSCRVAFDMESLKGIFETKLKFTCLLT